MTLKNLALLTAVAVAVPLWAIAQQYRHIDIRAAAEDDCPLYYGAYAISDVIGREDAHGHYVICRYK
jgi:hypothetical protein